MVEHQLRHAWFPLRRPAACADVCTSVFRSRWIDYATLGITRYADDLTFSTVAVDQDIGLMLTAIRNVVGDEGFTVNEEKTKVLRRSQAQEVT